MIERGCINYIPDFDLSEINFTDRESCYQQVDGMENYYCPENSSIWQMFENDIPDPLRALVDDLPDTFTEFTESITRIDPGNTVPYHSDKHYKIRQTAEWLTYGGETFRYLIFLEDWKSGHYFEIEGKPFLNWKKGDWVKFGQEDWHLAGNSGVDPFYAAQITVVENDK